jgi:predicted ATP-dependent endonuclease of OLD family
MIISEVKFAENVGTENYWEIKNLHFEMFNLLVGLNATGKTRLVNVISNFSKLITKKRRFMLDDALWDFTFLNDDKTKFKYKVHIFDKKIKLEEVKVGRKLLLKREGEKGKIYSYKTKKKFTINPPKDELTLHVRRDVKEFPFLEDIINWADNFAGYKFTSARPDHFIISKNQEDKEELQGLENVPLIFEKIKDNKKITDQIIRDFRYIGYEVDDIDVKSTQLPGVPKPVIITIVKEKDLMCITPQPNMSQGMYRALSLVIILNYILMKKRPFTVVVDDVGEGLDYNRATNLTNLIYEKLFDSEIQMIITSNDRFLINTIDLGCINVLKRDGHIVEAINNKNNKKLFEEFKYTGLNNFDLLSGGLFDFDGDE